ncbi:efflux RND transporter periplasmic adaptor subunit [endosymbiont of Lamellibrachia barhami]|uniref:efflux RND transporter periplasmic adaptor subunit n=1 Tax=endosymbiont of Lamellibrachia barhami TaxID=205975 RepID=UPI0015AA26A3
MASSLRRTLLTFLILLLTVFVVMALWRTRPQPEVVLKKPQVTRVEVVQAVARDINPLVRQTGLLRPWRVASLRFEVKGDLVERLVEPGQKVEHGQLLLRLDDADYRDAVTENEARLTETRAAIRRDRSLLGLAKENRKLAEQEYRRLVKLGEGSLSSASTRGSARQQLLKLSSDEARLAFSIESSQARLVREEAALKRAQRNLQRTRLLAPFDGLINRVEAEVGDYLQTSGRVVELIQGEFLELYVEVSGDVAAALTMGQKLIIKIDGAELEGELTALQPDPEAKTHTHPLQIRLPADGLLPGMLGEVLLPLEPRNGALVVPPAALLREEGLAYVFVVDAGRLQRRAVVPGIRYNGLQVILSGLAEGEPLVARDVEVLSDGIKVTVEAVESGR